MRRSGWFRGGILIGLLMVSLALYGAAQSNHAAAQTGLLVVLGGLAVVAAWSGK